MLLLQILSLDQPSKSFDLQGQRAFFIYLLLKLLLEFLHQKLQFPLFFLTLSSQLFDRSVHVAFDLLESCLQTVDSLLQSLVFAVTPLNHLLELINLIFFLTLLLLQQAYLQLILVD